MHQDVSGWSLEDWSLEHELLELRFHLWPKVEDVVDTESGDQPHAEKHYRRKELFSRPDRIVFHEFSPPATVDKVDIKKNAKNGYTIYRYSLAKGGFIEVEAKKCSSTLW